MIRWILLEQVVPATTLWLTGQKMENSVFHRQKFVWRRQRGCAIIPVECIPCIYNGQPFAYDCIDQTLECNITNITLPNSGNVILSNVINKVIEKNKDVRKKIDDEVFECTKKAIQKYNEKFKQAHISKDSGYQLLKYEKGGFYIQHVDSFIDIPRTISCSFILNNDFKGGEFSFFNNTLVYSLKKGSAIMFPSNFLYPHSVLPVIDGTRYSIVTWFL
jgi:hypothetical protein